MKRRSLLFLSLLVMALFLGSESKSLAQPAQPEVVPTVLAGATPAPLSPRGESFGANPSRMLRSEALGSAAALDGDHDGLLDAEEAVLGTDPQNRDTDGDALPDGWEVHGVNGINLRGMGADPRHKDIFVEMDYMKRASATNGLAPSQTVLDRIVAAFANAPLLNPDGTRGIRIHLELGNEVPFDEDLNPYISEFSSIKRANFDRNRSPVFHYMIWADAYDNGGSSGIAMSIPHNDFLVTLGRWNGKKGGTDNEKVGTFIHELGHCLGLRHGGDDNVNYKPGYFSVMNYLWQTGGVRKDDSSHFDYQRMELPRLDEQGLDEPLGFNGIGKLEGYLTAYWCPNSTLHPLVPAVGPLDWNCDGDSLDLQVRADLNGDQFRGSLTSYNDWASLIFTGSGIGTVQGLEALMEGIESSAEELPFVELTEEMNAELGNP